jgi:hypothetical protein
MITGSSGAFVFVTRVVYKPVSRGSIEELRFSGGREWEVKSRQYKGG